MKYSIITVNLNNATGLIKTIESVYSQSCNEYEYIIIDGLSSDNSMDIINSYVDKFKSKHIEYIVISEKDSGIYNAMNKGISLAQGEYVNFMNAGDMFADKNVLDYLYDKFEKFDILYGDTFISNGKKVVDYRSCTKWENCYKGMPFCHQSSFVRAKILKKYKFDEKFKVSADYDLFLRLYKDNLKAKQIYSYISIFDNSGISSVLKSDESDVIKGYVDVKQRKKMIIKEKIRKITPKKLILLKNCFLRKMYTYKNNQNNNSSKY